MIIVVASRVSFLFVNTEMVYYFNTVRTIIIHCSETRTLYIPGETVEIRRSFRFRCHRPRVGVYLNIGGRNLREKLSRKWPQTRTYVVRIAFNKHAFPITVRRFSVRPATFFDFFWIVPRAPYLNALDHRRNIQNVPYSLSPSGIVRIHQINFPRISSAPAVCFSF